MESELPDHVRALLERWSHPSTWSRLRQVMRNLGLATDLELAALLADPPPLDAPLPPTSVGVQMATRELNALGDEHHLLTSYLRERHPELLDRWPALPPAVVLDEAAAVRCAERVGGVYGRALAALRAPQVPVHAEPEWSDGLQVRQWEFVLDVPRNDTYQELQNLLATDHAVEESRQRWRVDLTALTAAQRQRYAEQIAKRRPKITKRKSKGKKKPGKRSGDGPSAQL